VVIVTPLYPPAIGGAAAYADHLATVCLRGGIAASVTVLTQAHPGCPAARTWHEGRLRVRRPFPYRAACPGRQWSRYPRYAAENARYLGLLARAWPRDSTLLVHGSLHLHPTSLDLVTRLLRHRAGRPRLVADLRDPRLPARRHRALRAYDAVITCGRAVSDSLAATAEVAAKAVEIPVPLEPPPPVTRDAAAATARRHGLTPSAYVFWSNGLLRRKNLSLALAALAHLRQGSRPDLQLAIAGVARDREGDIAAALDSGAARYLGPLSPSEVRALSAAAGVVLNVSPVEGMPRAALEAIAVDAPVLLPPGVPEFAAHCPDHIAATESAEALARQIDRVLTGPWPHAPYPLARHRPESLHQAYREVLCGPIPAIRE
jgi:glycosyltransferase involved in cell wall biosynthesis